MFFRSPSLSFRLLVPATLLERVRETPGCSVFFFDPHAHLYATVAFYKDDAPLVAGRCEPASPTPSTTFSPTGWIRKTTNLYRPINVQPGLAGRWESMLRRHEKNAESEGRAPCEYLRPSTRWFVEEEKDRPLSSYASTEATVCMFFAPEETHYAAGYVRVENAGFDVPGKLFLRLYTGTTGWLTAPDLFSPFRGGGGSTDESLPTTGAPKTARRIKRTDLETLASFQALDDETLDAAESEIAVTRCVVGVDPFEACGSHASEQLDPTSCIEKLIDARLKSCNCNEEEQEEDDAGEPSTMSGNCIAKVEVSKKHVLGSWALSNVAGTMAHAFFAQCCRSWRTRGNLDDLAKPFASRKPAMHPRTTDSDFLRNSPLVRKFTRTRAEDDVDLFAEALRKSDLETNPKWARENWISSGTEGPEFSPLHWNMAKRKRGHLEMRNEESLFDRRFGFGVASANGDAAKRFALTALGAVPTAERPDRMSFEWLSSRHCPHLVADEIAMFLAHFGDANQPRHVDPADLLAAERKQGKAFFCPPEHDLRRRTCVANLLPVFVERLLFDPETGIAGRCDVCFWDFDARGFVLADFKTSGRMSPFPFEQGQPRLTCPGVAHAAAPNCQLADASYSKAVAQLHVYSHLLRVTFGISVVGMYVFQISVQNVNLTATRETGNRLVRHTVIYDPSLERALVDRMRRRTLDIERIAFGTEWSALRDENVLSYPDALPHGTHDEDQVIAALKRIKTEEEL